MEFRCACGTHYEYDPGSDKKKECPSCGSYVSKPVEPGPELAKPGEPGYPADDEGKTPFDHPDPPPGPLGSALDPAADPNPPAAETEAPDQTVSMPVAEGEAKPEI